MPSTREERSLLGSLHAALRDAGNTVNFADSRLSACIPGEPLIACLVLTIIDPGTDHGPRRHYHEEEANDHITNRHDVMNIKIVTTDAQCPVIARCVVVHMLRIAMLYSNSRH